MFPVFAVAEAAAHPLPHVVTNPDWAERPGGADFARAYPEAAMKRNLEGKASINCTVTAEGALTNCFVSDEDPVGEGFGEAVLKLAAGFRMKPKTLDGVAIEGGVVRIPITFRLPGTFDRSAPDLIGAEACYGQVARVADHETPTVERWLAIVYWHGEMTRLIASGYGRPWQVETAAEQARLAAEHGTLKPPKGWELETCLAKAKK